MKKRYFALISLLSISLFTACNQEKEKTLTFESNELSIRSGDIVTIKESYPNVTYSFIDNPYDILLDSKTGKITYDNDIPNSTQVLYVAHLEELSSAPIVITLLKDYENATIEFQNLSNYIVDGEFITGVASLPYAVTYTLKEYVPGISINEYTGKVSYTSNVLDQTPFTVVAHTHNHVTSEKTFFTMTQNFIDVESNRQVKEKGSNQNAIFKLDFKNNMSVKEEGMIALTNEKNVKINEENYEYNKDTCTLKIKASYLNTLMDGENIFKIITSRNAITVQVDVATKFIYTPEDLASINSSLDSLQGYYILMDDIDMEQYLSPSGKGYNDGKGWNPIGVYDDVLDYNLATLKAFKGTFDGNGHVIKNLIANRKDTRGFNFGLFGYIETSATIKNLGVTGDVNVSSYSGGLVGSSSGIISNCWADVNLEVYSGSQTYRYVGGLVGNNLGIIENCYALGDVKCDSDFGSLVGYNEGDIINSYASKTENSSKFIGFGSMPLTNKLFESEDELKAFDWENAFSSEYWEFIDNNVPKLKTTLKEYEVRLLRFDNKVFDNPSFYGDNILLNSHIYPLEFEDRYKDEVHYELMKSNGASIENNIIHTTNEKDQEIIVKASLIIDGNTYEDTLTISLSKKIETLTFETNLTELKAGSSYELEASFTPSDAKENIIYQFESTDKNGISIEDNILTINEEASATSITLYAQSEFGGVSSNKVTLKINPLKHIGKIITYVDQEEDLSYTIDATYDLNDMNVTLFGKKIEFSLNNHTLTLAKDYVENLYDFNIPLILTLKDGTRLKLDIYHFSHPQYTEEYIKAHEENVIELSSIEDFKKYFNIVTYDVSKYENYDKTYVLTSDIDFHGEQIHAFSYASENYGDQPFKGKIYGCNHVISNFIVNQNELAYEIDANSSKYGVGLIGCLDGGSLYDMKLSKVTVKGNNFVGGLVGMMKGGLVENCEVLDDNTSTIRASDYKYSVLSESIRVGGIIGRLYEGVSLANYYEGTSYHVVG